MLRRRYMAERDALSADMVSQIGNGILQQLLRDPHFQRATAVMLYCATGNEVPTQAMLEHCLLHKKKVYIPRCETAGHMTACRIIDKDQLVPGRFRGILEPDHTCPAVAPNALEVVITPCVCADRNGYRIGYGGGYYDRFLADTHAVSLLLCPERFLLPNVFPEAHDHVCHKIITEKEILVIHEK